MWSGSSVGIGIGIGIGCRMMGFGGRVGIAFETGLDVAKAPVM